MIQYYDWLPQIEAFDNVESIENEIAIFTYSELVGIIDEKVYTILKSPHKFDFFLIMFHTKGKIKIKIDMVEYSADTPSNIIKVAPGQIVSLEEYSDDFDANVIIISKRFLESLLVYINGSIPLRIGTNMECIVKINDQEKAMLEILIRAIRHILSNKENPFRLQVVQHVIMAIFYSSEQIRNIDSNEAPRSNADVLSKEFLALVKDNFRRERQLQFYADKLCITPRYLSRVVKETSNSSAAEWIERYVVLEARALLKSTNMTIQQISDELNFPSQTFFGKYFKRRVGVSPKEYRRKG
ncbi:MAG: helix-turn-helix domain-containing protein [Rikenellaceae bacterium]|nr:helix-turn-helix domain-containing protein [Rikenellaceae bacterium]